MTESTPSPQKTNWLGISITALVLAWVIGVSYTAQFAALTIATVPDQLLNNPNLAPTFVYTITALVQGLLLLLPLVPLALLWRAPRYRAAYRALLVAALFLIVLSPVRLVSSASPQLALLLQLVLSALFALVFWLVTGRGAIFGETFPTTLAIAVILGILAAVPWLFWGALGSIGDILLGILTAVVFALIVVMTTQRIWLKDVQAHARGTRRFFLLGGFVIGSMLLVMGSAVGFSGTQLLFMSALSAFGWLVVVLMLINPALTITDAETSVITRQVPDASRMNPLAVLALLALVVTAPLLFLDPDAGVLLASLAPGDIFGYAINATALVIVVALFAGIILYFLRSLLASISSPALAGALAGAAVIGAVAIYFALGQPGLFGDRVFVIMRDQPNVSGATDMTDYSARRNFVYTTLVSHADSTQGPIRSFLDALRIPYTPYYLENAIEVSADLPVQWYLSTRSDVDRILPSPRLRPLPAPPPVSLGPSTSPPETPDWNLTLIGADRVWNDLGVRGQGILVGQSDSGVDGTHPELSAQYRGRDGDSNFNWFDPWNHSAAPTDFGGHGTHTLGSVLGKTVGVAPDAEWIGCVNLARNLGNPALYLDCLQFNFAPFPLNGDALHQGDPLRGAHVLNNSWGCPDVEGCDPNALLNAVNALRDAGIFVVASAGNEGPGCSSVSAPIALYDNVFSVAAVNSDSRVADFSSRGPVTADNSGRTKPDIGAPGVDVYSSFPGGTYETSSGTSMAGPHIAGVVALLWSANPSLIGDIDRTEQIIRETARPIELNTVRIVCGDPTAIPNDFVGYGIVDAFAAVQRALSEQE